MFPSGIDFGNFPEATGRSVVRWFFCAEAAATPVVWQPYEIPRNHSMVFIFAMGAGGGGGSGFSAASGNARGGGGGGGSGNPIRLLYPRALFADSLFITVGAGGSPGNLGQNTYVAVYPSISTQAYYMFRAGGGGAGGTGTGTTVGTGGGSTGAVAASFSCLGIYNSVVGINGGNGGAVAGGNGTAVVWGGAGIPFSSGAGGGGTTSADFSGGNITGAGLFPTISGGTGTTNGGDGVGQTLGKEVPFLFSGGAGGGASNAGVGGNGGNGGLGCGGGGGGGGTTGGTGGSGGNGFVMIQSW